MTYIAADSAICSSLLLVVGSNTMRTRACSAWATRRNILHTKGVAFVAGGLEAADLLLRGLEKPREVLLRKSGLLAERGDLQRHVPGLACALEPGGKRGVLQLLFEVTVEIGLLHRYPLVCQSRIRSIAIRM